MDGYPTAYVCLPNVSNSILLVMINRYVIKVYNRIYVCQVIICYESLFSVI